MKLSDVINIILIVLFDIFLIKYIEYDIKLIYFKSEI